MTDDNGNALKFQRPMRDYIIFFEKLSARSVGLLSSVASDNIYFKDPFNEVNGIENVEHIFIHMFKTLEQPRFKVIDYGFGNNSDAGYIRWHFSFTSKGKAEGFDGMSEVIFDHDGKVCSHIDYWDTGEIVYEKVPILGAVIRTIKSKLSAA